MCIVLLNCIAFADAEYAPPGPACFLIFYRILPALIRERYISVALRGLALRQVRRRRTAMREPNWTDGQFHVVLTHLDVPSEEMSRLIPRSAGAIDVVRSGIREYRRGRDPGILSATMKGILAAR